MNKYKHHAGIVLRIYPSDKQKRIIALNSGAQRYVYNHLVAVNNEIYRLSKTADYVPCDRMRIEYLKSTLSYTGIKNAAPFLYDRDTDGQVIANAKLNYSAAWNGMKKAHHGVPAFHKKSYEQSYQTNCHYSKRTGNRPSIRFTDERHIILPVLGRIRIAGSKKRIWQVLCGSSEYSDSFIRIGTVTISRDSCGDYFVSLALASDKPFNEYHSDNASFTPAGIDMNLSNFCTMSDGTVIPNPRYRKTMQDKIAKTQRKLARQCVRAKSEGRSLYRNAKNYQKTRLKLAKLHRKYTRQRDDMQGCVSCDAVKNHDIIAVEHLNVRGMIKNHKLAMAISDAGWYKFQVKLEQKAFTADRIFIKVPAKDTTQTCSHCGHVCREDDRVVLGKDQWDCPECGTHNMRDYNAAVNILNAGLKLLKLY